MKAVSGPQPNADDEKEQTTCLLGYCLLKSRECNIMKPFWTAVLQMWFYIHASFKKLH